MEQKVKIGDEFNLDIRKMGINGEGIGYYKNLAIFVDGAIVKETVKCRITQVTKNFAKGEVLEIIRKSTKRIEPICKFYERCGGCQIQHIEVKEQMKLKRNLIKESLTRYTKLDVENINILPVVMNEDIERGYRNKSQMPLKNTEFGLAMGLFQVSTNKFVYVDNCPVQLDIVNKINREVLSILRKYEIKASLNDKDGLIKYVITRSLINAHESQVTLSVVKYDERLEKIAKEIIQIPTVKTVAYTLTKSKDENVFGNEVVILEGEKYIIDQFLDFKVMLSPKSFYQLNTSQAQKIYLETIKLLDVKDTDVVIDGYSGIGLIGMMMAKKAKKVYEIEYSESSINDAKNNAKINNITNMEYIADKVENALPKILKNKPNILVVDPPRTGLDPKLIEVILKSPIEKIAYISCNHATLAKNLNELSKAYDIEVIEPFDFFYLTSHIESLVILNRKHDL